MELINHLLHLLVFLTPALLLKDDVPSPLRNPDTEATIVWEGNRLENGGQMVADCFRHQPFPEQCKSSKWSLQLAHMTHMTHSQHGVQAPPSPPQSPVKSMYMLLGFRRLPLTQIIYNIFWKRGALSIGS